MPRTREEINLIEKRRRLFVSFLQPLWKKPKLNRKTMASAPLVGAAKKEAAVARAVGLTRSTNFPFPRAEIKKIVAKRTRRVDLINALHDIHVDICARTFAGNAEEESELYSSLFLVCAAISRLDKQYIAGQNEAAQLARPAVSTIGGVGMKTTPPPRPVLSSPPPVNRITATRSPGPGPEFWENMANGGLGRDESKPECARILLPEFEKIAAEESIEPGVFD